METIEEQMYAFEVALKDDLERKLRVMAGIATAVQIGLQVMEDAEQNDGET